MYGRALWPPKRNVRNVSNHALVVLGHKADLNILVDLVRSIFLKQ